MQKLDKILSVVLIVLMLASICTNIFALTAEDITGTTDPTPADETIKQLGNTALSIITNVGIVLSIVLVAYLGVKYMMASSEGKAEYKKNMIPYLVGAILVFGASAIGKAVISFAGSATGAK